MHDPIDINVKPSIASKINWTQIIGVLAMLLAMFGVDLPPEQQASIVAMIVAAQSLITWVIRTWFTTSLTSASAKRMAGTGRSP